MSPSKKAKILYTKPHIARWIRPFDQNPAFLLMFMARVTQGDNRGVQPPLNVPCFTRPQVESYGDLLFDGDERNVSEDEANAFCERLIDRGHLGVLEHIQTSVHIVCSRACSHQIVRHRMASYLQVSQRHVAVNTFIRHCHNKEDRRTRAEMKRVETVALDAYTRLIAAGSPKELARMVLPQTAATHIIMTANLRAWRHFLSLRMDHTAQDEVRYIATDICDLLRQWFPPIQYKLLTPEEEGKE